MGIARKCYLTLAPFSKITLPTAELPFATASHRPSGRRPEGHPRHSPSKSSLGCLRASALVRKIELGPEVVEIGSADDSGTELLTDCVSAPKILRLLEPEPPTMLVRGRKEHEHDYQGCTHARRSATADFLLILWAMDLRPRRDMRRCTPNEKTAPNQPG